MKKVISLVLTPFLLLITACSTHYSASTGGYYRGHNHVSVGVSGHHSSGNVLGALIVGGIIGHLITEAAEGSEREDVIIQDDSLDDELVNGYSIDESEAYEQQSKWYQLGQDGHCYLMEMVDGVQEVISVVPDYSCN